MRTPRVLALLLAVWLCGACSEPAPQPTTKVTDVSAAQLAQDLAVLRAAKVYWNHMSIGGNLLEGVKRLTNAADEPNVIELALDKPITLPSAGFLAHSLGGKNGEPQTKMEAFEKTLVSLPVTPDLALMKICYVDIWGNTDVNALFEHYVATVKAARAARPSVGIVHITAPLQVKESGVKASFSKLTGIKDTTAQANIARHRYNELLRKRFAGEPIFDLAYEESIWPDGRAEVFERGGVTYPSLVPIYSDDGAHLNAAGQERIARVLIHKLAETLRTKTASAH